MHGEGLYSLHYNLAEDNPFRYRGYYYDRETGFYYLQSRYYDPVTGRFISPDTTDVLTATPMGLTDKNLYACTGTGLLGYNMYAYCNNNPVNMVDPTGEGFWSSLVKTVKKVAKKVVKTVESIVNSVEIEIGLDVGLGAEIVTVNAGGTASARGSVLMVKLDDGQLDLGQKGHAEFSATNADGFIMGKEYEEYDSFFDDSKDYNTGWQDCSVDSVKIFSFGFVLGLGFHVDISINLTELFE